MFCAISGKPPSHPVVSTRSKCLFEKSLLLQYIKENGTDPISKESMSASDIIEIDTSLSNSNTNALNSSTLNSNYSIPNLLSTLQNEWDAIMQENFLLRQKLDILSKNLSQALYERDAAKIIAAKYMAGRDMSLEPETKSTADVTIDFEKLFNNSKEYIIKTKPIVKKINSLQKGLLTTVESYKSSTCVKDIQHDPLYPIMRSTYSIINANDVFKNYVSVNVSKGDQSVVEVLSNEETQTFQIPQTIQTGLYVPEQSSIIFFHPDENSCGSFDLKTETIHNCQLPSEQIENVFTLEGVYSSILAGGSDSITYLAVCKSGHTYMISGSTASPLLKRTLTNEYRGSALHKDGLLLAIFSATTIQISNISKPNDPPTEIKLDGSSEINSIKFSSNGYWMFVGTENSVLTYDMRKSPMSILKTDLSNINSDCLWDIIPSGKIMSVFSPELQSVLFHKYEKSLNTWTEIGRVNLDISEEQPELQSFNLLFVNSALGCVIQTKKQTYQYMFK